MSNTEPINFKTPRGLKICLNIRYFFYQLTDTDKYYTDEEIADNATMHNAASYIETRYLIPNMLIQVFSVLAIVRNASVPTFCTCMFLLYLTGYIWRCAKGIFLPDTIVMFAATLYKATWWLFDVTLVALVIALRGAYLIIPYIAMRTSLFIFSTFGNHTILKCTQKKYATPFGDTEICAFRIFHLLSKSDLQFSDYIKQYISAIYKYENAEISPPMK